MTGIVDTNVILVANRQHEDVDEACVLACAKHLQAIMTDGRVAIDDAYRVLEEYQHKTTPRAGQRIGDRFVRWLLRNNANPERCDRIALVEHSERGFENFPSDARLANFDRSDRKFVAVALAHPEHPTISQASDSKWLGWAEALHDHGVEVEFLCPRTIQRYAKQKRARKKGLR